MVHRSTLPTLMLAAVATAFTACGSSSGNNAAPRVTAVPQQLTTGDSAFALDLASYVTDREAASLTFEVADGGGSFTGSVYSNTFETMGEYTVEFRVTDGTKVTTSSFAVRVTEANYAVVRQNTSGLLLLDTRTNAQRRVAAGVATPSVATGLSNGRLVYQLAAPSGQQLWIHDPLTRTSTRLAATATGDVTYRAKTSDNKIVYSVGTGDALAVYFFNPATGVAREISQNSLSTLTVLVNANDLVFYEIGVSGQADVYAYDPSADETFAVGTASTDEQVLAVQQNGGVVFSRIGGGGEHDLFSYRTAVGLVEIGSDVSAIAAFDKTFNAAGSASQVVFTATSGPVSDIYAWNPSTGQTAGVSAAIGAGAWDVFAAMGTGNEVVWNRVVSVTEADAYYYDLDSGVSATLRNGADISQVLGVSGDNATRYAYVVPSGTPTSILAVSLVASPATATWAAGSAVNSTLGLLSNGDVVAQRTSGAGLNLFDVSAGTWGTAIVGTGLAFAGQGLAAEDFVYSLSASGQTDLSMWDASGSTSVVVSNTVGNDVWQATTLDGTVLFTRVSTGVTNSDLFVWNGTATTQLTADDETGLRFDHAVIGSYTGAR